MRATEEGTGQANERKMKGKGKENERGELQRKGQDRQMKEEAEEEAE